MSRLYPVEVTITFVVVADDATHAESVACNHLRDAVRDDSLDDYFVGSEIKNATSLPPEWSAACMPYGDDEKTIGTIFAEQPPLPPERDTKTIDMFEVAP